VSAHHSNQAKPRAGQTDTAALEAAQTDQSAHEAAQTDVAAYTNTAPSEATQADDVANAIVELCRNNSATEIVVYSFTEQEALAAKIIIATVGSDRISDSLSEDIRAYLKTHGLLPAHGVPRHDHSGWIIIDCGTVIAHLMHAEKRRYYELDDLYSVHRS